MAVRGEGLTITYFALDTRTSAGKTGDAANHTLRWTKDGTPAAPTNSPAEVDATNCPGLYSLALTDAEANCEAGTLGGKSSTANVVIIPVQVDFAGVVSTVAGEVMTALYGAGANKGSVDDAAATTTAFKTDLPLKASQYYANQAIVFTSGNLAGQSGNVKISATSGGKTRLQLKAALTAAPADNDEFVVLGRTA